MKKIYLAGFDVFRRDAVAHGERLKALCRQHGVEGLYPLDNVAPRELAGAALAQWICHANLDLVRRADAVVANLNPFRGHEPDSGTAFEVGYAVALQKPVWAYTRESRPLVHQLTTAPADHEGRYLDRDGYTVEDFGLNLNLMIACTASIIVGDIEDCLTVAATALRA